MNNKYSLNENSARFLSNGDGLEMVSKFKELAEKADPVKVANTLINKPESRLLSNEEFLEFIKSQENSDVSEERIEAAVAEVLKRETDAVEKLKSGKDQVLMYLVGQVMKDLRAKVDSAKIIDKIKSKI